MCLRIIQLLMKFKFSNTYCKHAEIIFILRFFGCCQYYIIGLLIHTVSKPVLHSLQSFWLCCDVPSSLGGCSETCRTNVVRWLITKQTLLVSQHTTLVRPVSEQPLRMARRGTAQMFGANVQESLTWCEPEYLEYNAEIIFLYFINIF